MGADTAISEKIIMNIIGVESAAMPVGEEGLAEKREEERRQLTLSSRSSSTLTQAPHTTALVYIVSSSMAPKLLSKIDLLPTYASIMARLNLVRAEIFVRVLPIVLLSIGLRVTLETLIPGWSGIFDASTVTPFATASMFVIAIILGGVSSVIARARAIPVSFARRGA
jgi:hypothetical protein